MKNQSTQMVVLYNHSIRRALGSRRCSISPAAAGVEGALVQPPAPLLVGGGGGWWVVDEGAVRARRFPWAAVAEAA